MDHKLTFTYRSKSGVVRRMNFDLPPLLSGILTVEIDGKQLEIARVDNSYVTLPEGLITHNNGEDGEAALAAGLADAITRLPWTRRYLTRAEFQDWLATRKAAGAAIDTETCELGKWYAHDADPYGADDDLDEEMCQIGTNRWVRSPESKGWVNEQDLPPEMVGAMYERIHREYEAWVKEHPEDARKELPINADGVRARIRAETGSDPDTTH
jgi:hypothetical protein